MHILRRHVTQHNQQVEWVSYPNEAMAGNDWKTISTSDLR
jgi:hypothetical protein